MKEQLISAPSRKEVDSLRLKNQLLARKLSDARKQLLAIGKSPRSRSSPSDESEDGWDVKMPHRVAVAGGRSSDGMGSDVRLIS